MKYTVPTRDAIQDLLQEIGAPGAFAAHRTAAANDLDLEVKEVGPLRFPISSTQAEQLCQVARPARYGKGEQTLLDRRVRDTSEIPKSRVKIDQERWNRTLHPMLDLLRADLGLPDGCRLKPELHSLLVYAPGQFFLPHRDSEKADDMVGTLVVTLPSPFKGGDFVIEHQGERVVYRGSEERLSFVAFYADCKHEVLPVKEGYRIVLTYNLVLEGEGVAAASGAGVTAPATAEALAESLRRYFTTPLPNVWGSREREPPNRLVYLLDHQYTERGLGWHLLKGKDAARAAALRAAAERSGCKLALALADVQERWESYGSEEPTSEADQMRRHWERDENNEWYSAGDAPLKESLDEYPLYEFLSRFVTLHCWSDPEGKKFAPIVTRPIRDEVCFTAPSSDLEAYAAEYASFTGNEGSNLDRWYHRAAVVLWPRERPLLLRRPMWER